MMCRQCGNDVADPAHCPICAAGRGVAGTGSRRRTKSGDRIIVSLPPCPRCGNPLEGQNWEGVTAAQCTTCRGTFFPDFGLEATLDKLRATCDPKDVQSVMKDFKERFNRELPENVRYKKCPVCDTVMTRRNYGTVSGVIVDVCGDHGTWVDEQAFAALADFVCRGGDLISEKVSQLKTSFTGPKKDRGLLDRLFGAG